MHFYLFPNSANDQPTLDRRSFRDMFQKPEYKHQTPFPCSCLLIFYCDNVSALIRFWTHHERNTWACSFTGSKTLDTFNNWTLLYLCIRVLQYCIINNNKSTLPSNINCYISMGYLYLRYNTCEVDVSVVQLDSVLLFMLSYVH